MPDHDPALASDTGVQTLQQIAQDAQVNCGTVKRNPAGIGLWKLFAEDFATHERDPLSQGFWTIFWHRFGNWRMSIRARPLRIPFSVLYRFGAKASQWFCGMDLPYTVVVGRRVKLEHFGGMILIARAIGNDVVIRQNTTFGIRSIDALDDRPTIGDGVDIGAGAFLIGGITIGNNTRIGGNTVVMKSLPANVVAAGVPARIINKNEGF